MFRRALLALSAPAPRSAGSQRRACACVEVSAEEVQPASWGPATCTQPCRWDTAACTGARFWRACPAAQRRSSTPHMVINATHALCMQKLQKSMNKTARKLRYKPPPGGAQTPAALRGYASPHVELAPC